MKHLMISMTMLCAFLIFTSAKVIPISDEVFCGTVKKLIKASQEPIHFSSFPKQSSYSKTILGESWKSKSAFEGADSAVIVLMADTMLFTGSSYTTNLVRSKNIDDILWTYIAYRKALSQCMAPEMKLTETDNDKAEIKSFKKLKYRKPESEAYKKTKSKYDFKGQPGRPEVQLEVTQSSYDHFYRLTLTVSN
jgi:hypothetical protein